MCIYTPMKIEKIHYIYYSCEEKVCMHTLIEYMLHLIALQLCKTSQYFVLYSMRGSHLHISLNLAKYLLPNSSFFIVSWIIIFSSCYVCKYESRSNVIIKCSYCILYEFVKYNCMLCFIISFHTVVVMTISYKLNTCIIQSITAI